MKNIHTITGKYRLIGILLLGLVISACAAVDPFFHGYRPDLPPVLMQDELIRPYVKIARIQVTREFYVVNFDGLMPSDIHEWGIMAIRSEAVKMGADAVIFPEVTGSNSINNVLPSTEYRATGVAIKFK
jgi:hypothetical protein